MIRKLKSGKYRLYSRKVDAKTGKRRNLGTFDSRGAAEKHDRDVQFFQASAVSAKGLAKNSFETFGSLKSPKNPWGGNAVAVHAGWMLLLLLTTRVFPRAAMANSQP